MEINIYMTVVLTLACSFTSNFQNLESFTVVTQVHFHTYTYDLSLNINSLPYFIENVDFNATLYLTCEVNLLNSVTGNRYYD